VSTLHPNNGPSSGLPRPIPTVSATALQGSTEGAADGHTTASPPMAQAVVRTLAARSGRSPMNTDATSPRFYGGSAPGRPRYGDKRHLNKAGPKATKDRPVVTDDVGLCSFQRLIQGEKAKWRYSGGQCRDEVSPLLMKRWMAI
jgi:hypothetical protein